MSTTAPPLRRAHNIKSANGLIAAELRTLPDHRPFHRKSNSAGQVFMRRLISSFRGRKPQHPHPPSTKVSTPKQDLTVPRVPLSDSDPVLVDVPSELLSGTMMTKVSIKRQKRFLFRLDPDVGQIVYVSKKVKIIPIDNIKELRKGADMQPYREAFGLEQGVEERWLTIIYVLPSGAYKALHLIADTVETFSLWDTALQELCAIRQELMQGLGSPELREKVWLRRYWKEAEEAHPTDMGRKIAFEEVVRLCRRLSINSSREDLLGWFKRADIRNEGYLDYDDFRNFVTLLKTRADIDRLYKRVKKAYNPTGRVFNFMVFEAFMVNEQKTLLRREELIEIFEHFAQLAPSDPSAPISPTVSDNAHEPSNYILSPKGFASFLLSIFNSAHMDRQRSMWMDMTLPMSEYYISSSHNTYLVGHQLVGESSIEGYVRALLSGCRSVELDIYDGPTHDSEPQIFHGKTLTSKVPLRQVCHTIMKYGFVVSPYPIIISAEVHLSLAGQDKMAEIMVDVFGERLVRKGENGIPEQDDLWEDSRLLPSPEDLKGKILLKTKNLSLASAKGKLKDNGELTSPPSASDSEAIFSGGFTTGGETGEEIITVYPNPTARKSGRQGRRQSDSFVRDQIWRAGSHVLKRVKTTGRTSVPVPAKGKGKGKEKEKLDEAPPTITIIGDMPLSTSPPSTLLSSSATNLSLPRTVEPLRRALSYQTERSGTLSPPSIARNHSAVSLKAPKVKLAMSPALISLLVYTVGVKCRGLNKKEVYANNEMFSLSEGAASKMLKWAWWDLVKHARNHLVRIYPRGVKRVASSNFVPLRYWMGGAQLVALNWQTWDLGMMMNWAMFERNGKTGWVLKPETLRSTKRKEDFAKKKRWKFSVTVISAQQLVLPNDTRLAGRKGSGPVEGASGLNPSGVFPSDSDEPLVDPFVEVTLFVPPWPSLAVDPADGSASHIGVSAPHAFTISSARVISSRTSPVMKNGFNPVWEETLSMTFESVGGDDMLDLVFVRFLVRNAGIPSGGSSSGEPVSGGFIDEGHAVPEDSLGCWMTSMGSLQQGYRHIPLHDSHMSQYLFSTLFVKIQLDELVD